MSEQNESKECARPGCRCPVPGGEKFCCPRCAEAFDETDCGCGHAECRAQA